MLDLTVAMNQLFAVILAIFFLQGATPVIVSPQPGADLRGQVSINGVTDIPNFASAELDFAYASGLTSTWFLIQTSADPVANGQIAVWNTTALTDGNYNLRLRVFLQDGTPRDVIVKDLHIQNDVIANPTEAPTLPSLAATPATASPLIVPPPPTSTPVATATPAFPTPTALPSNTASLNESSIFRTFQRGALWTLFVFVLAGIAFRLRRFLA